MLKNLRKELTFLGAKVKLRKSGLGLLSRAKEVKRGMGGERVMTVREKRICDVIKSCWRCKKFQNAELKPSPNNSHLLQPAGKFICFGD